jgi:hypothetical protein
VILAIVCQIALLGYHQVTTLVDLFPFNGARNYSGRERLAEVGINGVLMSLGPMGFLLGSHGLMLYGVIYYFVLLAIETIIWWIPYFSTPTGLWRRAYNYMLSVATSDFEKGDTLKRWLVTNGRLHGGTLTLLPLRRGHIVPNLEHMILHGLTMITAVATLGAYRAAGS